MEELSIRRTLILLLWTLCGGWATAATAIVPFQPDEIMDYEVRWKPPLFFLPSMHAGITTLRVRPSTTYEGKPAFHFSATARSDGFLTRLGGINVEDSFESIVSVENFCARKIVKIQREGDRKRDILITFDPENGTTRVVEKNVAFTPPRVTRDETLPHPSCAVDVLSIFYAARRFELEVGKSFNITLSDNGTTRPITITVEEREKVNTGEGLVSAFRISTGSAMGVFSRGGTFTIWYSDDELRVPVKFEAKVKVGKLFGWLRSYQGRSKLNVVEETGRDDRVRYAEH
ncbi:MAG: DUF3108 domain-containing protein [Acidobacteria bacterium]|nr:DUF3108 domain-containing protein [Acidobacteriota bacterium]